VIRGLNVLYVGLKQTGQDWMHQLVRSLEALVLPDIANVKSQFVHRCETFSKTGADTRCIRRSRLRLRGGITKLGALAPILAQALWPIANSISLGRGRQLRAWILPSGPARKATTYQPRHHLRL
jgi:hypothetical protein